MCRLMGVTRSGFYHYEKQKSKKFNENSERKKLLEWMIKIAEASNFSYGHWAFPWAEEKPGA
jgi:hypothetical protein